MITPSAKRISKRRSIKPTVPGDSRTYWNVAHGFSGILRWVQRHPSSRRSGAFHSVRRFPDRFDTVLENDRLMKTCMLSAYVIRRGTVSNCSAHAVWTVEREGRSRDVVENRTNTTTYSDSDRRPLLKPNTPRSIATTPRPAADEPLPFGTEHAHVAFAFSVGALAD